MIGIEHLTKRYGRVAAVDGLGFSVAPGESVALWGPNGAGKTTVIKCLLGLLRYEGSIRVGGLDAARDGRAVRARLGYVPQELAFQADVGTLDTARFFARLRGARADEAESRLEQVGLESHAAKAVGALSGGMKQRLALALALLGDPPVLVLDEPTANLDAAAREQLLGLLAGVREAGKTILLTSHRLEEVGALTDWVLVMDSGREALRCAAADLADATGARARMRLVVAPTAIEDALEALSRHGMPARRNGVGIIVEVPPGRKADPIVTLTRSGIAVSDFEME
jgi:ABC-type multidrug transport system ATPase subunit